VIRVLVVDDDFMVARLHSTLVEQVPGFTVVAAVHSGTDALAAVRELRPDLVLLDMYLPDVPGLEVLRELRGTAAPEEGPDVLVVTAARDVGTVRGAQRGGAVQYVIKPFEGQLLQERLRRYAERREALASLQAPEQGDVDRLFGGPAAARPGGDGTGPAPGGEANGDSGGAGGGAGAGSAAATGTGHGTGTGTGTGTTVPSRLPKGLTEQTAGLVRATLEEAAGPAGLSASECAARSGLSRVSARRYLEHFVLLGTARVTLRYGTTGRPERRYHRIAPRAPEEAPDETQAETADETQDAGQGAEQTAEQGTRREAEHRSAREIS
jgi:response regulator of citrate/malate metabolism